MEWEALKSRLMQGLDEAKEKDLVDWEIVPHLDRINAFENLATSSSCYGRIIFIDVPTGVKKDSRFLYKWHRQIDYQEFLDALQKAEGARIWFKMDPFILHISARDVESARLVLEAKTRAGIKRGGIFSIKPRRVQLEIEGSQKMEVPVKFNGDVLITDKMGRVLVSEANLKMEKNVKQLDRFVDELEKVFSNGEE